MKPFEKASNRKKSSKNADYIDYDRNPDFITKYNISEFTNLHTNINTSNDKNTGFCDKDNITPKSINIFRDFACNNGLAKNVHIQRINHNRNNSRNSKHTKLRYQVNTVIENNQYRHNQDTIIDDSFQAKQRQEPKQRTKQNTT